MRPEQEACTGSVHRYTLHGDAQGAYIGMCCSRCGTQHLFLLNFTQLLTAQPSHSSGLLCETSPPLRQLLLTHLQPYSECVQVLCAVTSEHWRRTGPPMEPGGAWLCTALALPAACPGVLKPLGQPLSGFRDRSSHGGGGQHEQQGPGPHCQPQRSWPRPSAGSHKGRMLHHRRPPSHCRRHGGGKASGSGLQRLLAAWRGPGCSPSPRNIGLIGQQRNMGPGLPGASWVPLSPRLSGLCCSRSCGMGLSRSPPGSLSLYSPRCAVGVEARRRAGRAGSCP